MTEKYSDIRDSLDTGDVVLFSGKGGISTGIKWFTNSKWSHVGMVFRLPEWNIVLLWESTILGDVSDVITNKFKKGVQLVALSERLKPYRGEVSIRRLKVERTKAMMEALISFRQEVKDRPYEKKELELLKSAYDGWNGKNEEDLSSLFCSELVAEAYQRMGLLSSARGSLPSNEYTPKDFSSEGRPIELLKNARLEEEIFVSYT